MCKLLAALLTGLFHHGPHYHPGEHMEYDITKNPIHKHHGHYKHKSSGHFLKHTL